jgi:hypothetical protein
MGFGERRVRLNDYIIWAMVLKSWVLEGSVDGESWTQIDRRTDTEDFKDGWKMASFRILNCLTEFRFVRLTQTDKNHHGSDYLLSCGVEFCGTLFE